MNPYIGAIVLIVLGTVLLLNNLGITRILLGSLIATWWPLILIVLGISMIARHRRKR